MLERRVPDKWEVMWRDMTIVVQDLFRDGGWKRGRLKKVFGLTWRELDRMIGRPAWPPRHRAGSR